jgi:PAS domain-containing protein
MGMEDDILALIDLIYETAFDSTLWPAALTRLADVTGTAQVGLASLDRRARTYESIAPRIDPAMGVLYQNYWVFRDPLWPLATQWPAGIVFSFENIMSRKDFFATPVFNEWFRPAEFGPAMMGANLMVGDQISSILCVANAPTNDDINDSQKRAFKAALRHIDRAFRMHREFRIRDLDHDTAPARLETLQRSVMLVDGAARVLFANAAARTLFGSGGGLTIKAGCLDSTDDSDVVQRLIASCARRARAPNGPGGEMAIERLPLRAPLRVTVTPLRSKGNVAEIPWLGLGMPVAIVTVIDSAMEKSMH